MKGLRSTTGLHSTIDYCGRPVRVPVRAPVHHTTRNQ